jgi:hypothetical protein
VPDARAPAAADTDGESPQNAAAVCRAGVTGLMTERGGSPLDP